ncbi:alpha/beta hydrolase [Pedobacter sp. BS3]|uniref:alpha/beta fold hydrolase n=1 Tax=Pedobacter sp. BS3 TaxID=2567937 RepID=UPI0011EC1A23|nr:alpha/beta hydrolase [Pedobacter sp. BS3]TZF83012.1 alpha/beta hydrolase [Pedobacter sp. BS3]
MQKIIFYHGGPGMNGNPERHLLTEPLKKAGFELLCWDEPSSLRPGGYPFEPEKAFENYRLSAAEFLNSHASNEDPAIVIIYCFSSYIINHLIATHAERIKLLCIISPDFHIEKSERSIFNNLLNEFRLHQETGKASQMEEIIANYSGKYDANTEKGWELAASCPYLFNFYWHDEQLMQQYLQYYQDEYSIDPESFFNVRAQISEPAFKTDIPAVVIYGKHDRIISIPDEIKAIHEYLSNVEIVELEHAGHYPHIEETDKVISVIKRKAEATK